MVPGLSSTQPSTQPIGLHRVLHREARLPLLVDVMTARVLQVPPAPAPVEHPEAQDQQSDMPNDKAQRGASLTAKAAGSGGLEASQSWRTRKSKVAGSEPVDPPAKKGASKGGVFGGGLPGGTANEAGCIVGSWPKPSDGWQCLSRITVLPRSRH